MPAVSFQYIPNKLAAEDEAVGLRLEQDLTFYDETTARLRVRCSVSGQTLSFPIRCENAEITYDTPQGPHTSHAMIRVGLPRAQLEAYADAVARDRRYYDRPMPAAEVMAAIEAAAFVVLTTG